MRFHCRPGDARVGGSDECPQSRAEATTFRVDGSRRPHRQNPSCTLKSDVGTYRGMHDQMLELAISAGLLFHSAHDLGSQVGIVDFWPTAEARQSFAEGPLGEG